MADYESLAHLPRWRRVVIWLAENQVGQLLWGLPLLVMAFLPAKWLGLWWLVLIVVAGAFFALGWNAARRRWMRDGWLDKL